MKVSNHRILIHFWIVIYKIDTCGFWPSRISYYTCMSFIFKGQERMIRGTRRCGENYAWTLVHSSHSGDICVLIETGL